MKNKLWILLRIQLCSQLSLNALSHEKDSRKRHRIWILLVMKGLLFLFLAGYSFLIAYGYGSLGMAEVIPGYALALSSLVTLAFTFVKTNGCLFAFRDYDMVMALPVSAGTVITSRFLYMYLSNLVFWLCVMVPMGVSYGIWRSPGILVYPVWLVCSCLAPLIPMTVAASVGALIAAVGSRFRFKVFVQAVLSLLLILTVFAASFALQKMEDGGVLLQQLAELGKLLQSKIHQLYPPALFFDQAVNESSGSAFLTLLFFAAGIYGIFVALVSRNYKAVNTALMTFGSRGGYRVEKLKTHTVMTALVKKEERRFFSSITYLMNTGIGMVMAVMAAVAFVIVGADRILLELNLGEMQQRIAFVVPFGFNAVLTMTCTTSVSWSLEGKQVWILKSLPLEERTIDKSKMIFNAILLAPAAVIINVCLAMALKPGAGMIFLYFLVSASSIWCSTVFGLWVGKRFVNFAWENEVEVIKQGLASMLGMFGNMLFHIGMGVLAFLLCGVTDGGVVLGFLAGVQGILGAFVFYKLTVTVQHVSKMQRQTGAN